MKSQRKRKASKVTYKTHRKAKAKTAKDFQKLFRERFYI